ncbi:hypothetical protein HHI36_015588 [Cryptolaemus montrouzieri]|uniref:Cyclin A n=1 Tax=Cryptolaemus montrouzieri TaxID=559131 RepID=A0ABD2N7C0_9CUCU
MATFKIHKDNAVVVSTIDGTKNKEKNSKIPKRFLEATKRPALHCVNNGIRQENKKIKISNKENLPPVQEKPINTKKEEKAKHIIDTDLLKIVPDATIKKKDAPNPSSKTLMLSTEYSADIWNYYMETEYIALPKPNYMSKQAYLDWNHRRVLVDWLVSVADEYHMSEDTLYLAVNYVDRFLSKISVVREKLQLVGASSMLIAGKMEEIYPPMPKEFAYLTCDSYTTRQVIKMEQLIMKVLEFKLQPPTSYTFVKNLCSNHELDEATTNLALYLSELVLLEGEHYLNYKPSEIAAASILYARYNLMKPKLWPKEIEKSSGYCIRHLEPIVKAQWITFQDSPNKKEQSIQTKYKSSKYGRVALLKPRSVKLNFSLQESEKYSSSSIDDGGELRT